MESNCVEMESERIEIQYNDSKELNNYLMVNGEVSYATYIDSVYKKVLVLSAASYFESVISKLILQLAGESNCKDRRIVKLIQIKVIERQYHTLFDWKAKNTNAFWSLFGEETKNKVRLIINEDDSLKAAEQSFIYIGSYK